MTLICDNCNNKMTVGGYFTFNSKENVVIWKGHLCCPCQVALVSGKGLQNNDMEKIK